MGIYESNSTTDEDNLVAVIKDESTSQFIKIDSNRRTYVDSLITTQSIDSNWLLAVARGNVTGIIFYRKFGRNDDFDSGTMEDVVSFGGTYSFPSSAASTQINSSSNSDKSAGTGARTVTVEGLDSNYDEISEVVTMNGTTNVTLTNSYLRVNRASVTTAGSGEINQGDIQIFQGGNTLAEIPEDLGQTQQAVYTVPAGKTLYIQRWRCEAVRGSGGGSGNREIEVYFKFRPQGGAFRTIDIVGIDSNGGPFSSGDNWITSFPEKSDIKISAIAESNNTRVTAAYEGYLIND